MQGGEFHLFTRYRGMFLEKLRELAPVRAFARAVSGEGTVAVLGGFRKVPPHDRSGWISRVRSRHGRTWLFAMLVDEERHTLTGQLIESVPWDQWGGKVERTFWNAYDGDNPKEADRERRKHLLLRRSGVLRGGNGDQPRQGVEGNQ